jgi:spoIIIJ-associated protein
MRSVEAEGESIDAAIDAALEMLQVARDRVDIEIVSNAARGLLGFGARKAKVRATLRQPISERILDESNEPATPPTPVAKPRREQIRQPPPRSTPVGTQTQPPQRPAAEQPDSAVARRAEQVLSDIVAHIGVTAQVQSSIEDDSVVLQLTGDSSGILIGRKGQMLDALEYMVARIVSRDNSSAVRVIIDCEHYRDRRRESLQELARRMGEEAKRKRRIVKLNAMSPRDRRIVHMILQQDPSITTRSAGKGHFRKLIIIPNGSNEPPPE